MSDTAQIAQRAKDLAKMGLVVPSRYPSKVIVQLVNDYAQAARKSCCGSDHDAAMERCRYRDLMEALADMEGTP